MNINITGENITLKGNVVGSNSKIRIYLKESKEEIGYLEYHSQNNYPLGNIGYFILKEYRCKGYAYESIQLFNSFISEYGIENLTLVVSKDNIPSISLAKKLGSTVLKENDKYYIFMISTRKEIHSQNNKR